MVDPALEYSATFTKRQELANNDANADLSTDTLLRYQLANERSKSSVLSWQLAQAQPSSTALKDSVSERHTPRHLQLQRK